MPITQFMRKLTRRESPRQRQEGSQLTTGSMKYQATAMDCDFCQHPTVTAEIVPMQDGRRSPCSPSSTASSEEALERLPTAPFGRTSSAPMGSSATSDLTVALLPSSPAAVSSQPAAARALRARGKAALRSSTLEIDEPIPSSTLGERFQPLGSLQQQTSFEQIGLLDSGASSSSSVEAQLSHMSMSPSSHGYQRAATAPLPPWAPALTININTGPGSTNAPAGPSTNPAAAGTILAAPVTAEEDEFGSPLHSPLVSPCSAEAEAAAGDDAFWCEECELHCEWEDGVVANWFKDQDHNQLLEILHTEGELEPVDHHQPTPTTSAISLQAVYSSSLYTRK